MVLVGPTSALNLLTFTSPMLSAAARPTDLSDHVSLRIVVPPRCVRMVVASNAALVSALKRVLPNPDSALIFNGALLSDEQTLGFYRLQSNDSLVAIPRSSAPDAARRWVTLTRDLDSFADSLDTVLNPRLRRESMRLRDRVAWRAELRPHFHRRMQRQMRATEPRPPACAGAPTAVPERPAELATGALPVCW
jgi:hypothetical protein